MNSIECLVHEHENITRLLAVAQTASLQILSGSEPDGNDIRKMIVFIRKYADEIHHGKEEKFLFKEMEAGLGPAGEKLVRNGMLVEHDLGRLYVSELEMAINSYEQEANDEKRLAILVALGSYISLLKRHIAKENEVVFPFGERNLPEEKMQWVEEKSRVFEQNEENIRIKEEQLRVLAELEDKYLSLV